jgi:ABC-type branched-subunit amino acid transport system substrate-binding protein
MTQGMRRPSFLFFVLSAIPVGLVVMTTSEGCKEKTDVPSDPPIVIGATVDLTKQKDFGAGCQRVLRVAEQQINAVGGILGRRVVLDIRDDGGDNKSIGGIGEEFIKKKVAGFVGPSTTEALEVIHGNFRVARIPILSPLTTSPRVPLLQEGRDRYVFRTSCAVEYQSRAIARYAIAGSFANPGGTPIDGGVIDSGVDSGPKDAGADAKTDGGDAGKIDAGIDAGTDAGTVVPPGSFKACRKMAAIYAEDVPGQGSSTIKSLVAEYAKLGGTIKEFIVQASAGSYEADVTKVVAAARAGEIECQTMLLFPGDGGKFMRELRRQTQGDPAFAADRFPSYGFIRFYQQGFIEAGRADPKNTAEVSQVEGVLGSACRQERPDSPEWTRFNTLYTAQWPELPDAASIPPPIPQIYDSVILLALAIEKAGSLDDRAAIRDALYAVSAPPGDAFGPTQLAEALEAVRLGRDIDYVGAAGSFDLDDQGDTALEVIMWKVEGNGFVTIPGLDSAQLRQ